MEELRVAGLRALADLGGSYLEVDGKIVIRQARRFSEFANQPDSILDVEEARIRVHGPWGAGVWESVEGVSLNRAKILLMIPIHDRDPGAEASLYSRRQPIRAKLFMTGLQITGFVPVPLQDTVASFLEQLDTRFLAVNQARITSAQDGTWLEDLPDIFDFCVVNRGLIGACIESRPEADALPE